MEQSNLAVMISADYSRLQDVDEGSISITFSPEEVRRMLDQCADRLKEAPTVSLFLIAKPPGSHTRITYEFSRIETADKQAVRVA